MREQKTVINCDLCGEEMSVPRKITSRSFDGHKNHTDEEQADVCGDCVHRICQNLDQAATVLNGKRVGVPDQIVDLVLAYELMKVNRGSLCRF